MTESPTDIGAALLIAIRARARDTQRPTDELIQHFVLEAFLDRLTQSEYKDSFILKGGMLVTAFGTRRPTRDVDLQGERVSNDLEEIERCISEIVRLPISDGVVFDDSFRRSEVIRESSLYTGVRVSMRARIARSTATFHVDVSVGDPIIPKPSTIELPRMFGGVIVLRGYPVEMILAEKIVTAVARGKSNTRWRDFTDVLALAESFHIDGRLIIDATQQVAEHRGVHLESLAESLADFPALSQTQWIKWRAKRRVEESTPADFEDVVQRFIDFADPIVMKTVTDKTWNPDLAQWCRIESRIPPGV